LKGAGVRLLPAGRARTRRDDHGRSRADGEADGGSRLHLEPRHPQWRRTLDSSLDAQLLRPGLAEAFSEPWTDAGTDRSRARTDIVGEFACIERAAEGSEARAGSAY